MPPIMRRASFYEKMVDDFQEMDSFKEDDSHSNDSSQSNYSNQGINNPQITLIKNMGLLDPNNEESNGLFKMFEYSKAKSSIMDPTVSYQQNKIEQKKQRIIIAQRKQIIQQAMKKSRCRTLFSILVVVLCISSYLAMTVIYSKFMFEMQFFMKEQLIFFHKRNNCFPYSIDVLKEIIAGGISPFQQNDKIISESERQQIVLCYEGERGFQDILLGTSNITHQLSTLSEKYMSISQKFETSNLCQTLMKDQENQLVQNFCATYSNGINNQGLTEVLNYILRQEEKLVLQYSQPPISITSRQRLFQQGSLMELETLLDIFIFKALNIQRIEMEAEIGNYTLYLYLWFYILYGSLLGLLTLGTLYLGFVYLTQNYQKRIVQIYHIVMLIPYGDKTHKEINQLIKINL